MKAIPLVLVLLFTAAGAAPVPDFRVVLSHYSRPTLNRDWSISIYRVERKIFIEVENFGNRRYKNLLTGAEYAALLDFLNARGIWTLKDRYQDRSPNGYHRIEIESGSYRNSFRVESGPPLVGDALRYREIIRRMENLARMKLRD